MDLTTVYESLKALKDRKAIPKEHIDYLKNIGLVETLSSDEYKKMESEAKQVESMQKEVSKNASEWLSCDSDVQKLSSRFNRFFRGKQLAKKEKELKELDSKGSEIWWKFRDAQFVREKIGGYVPQGNQFASLNEYSNFLLNKTSDSEILAKTDVKPENLKDFLQEEIYASFAPKYRFTGIRHSDQNRSLIRRPSTIAHHVARMGMASRHRRSR